MEKSVFSFDEKIRIDKYLADQNPGISRRVFQTAIKNGLVLVNDEKVSPNYKLKKGDAINILKPIEKVVENKKIMPNKDIPLDIIFQNKDFIVINKNAGISVHPSGKGEQNTLVNSLIYHFPKISKVGENLWRPGIVHRLDKDTSGIMLVALNQQSFLYLKNLFQERTIQKTYFAITWGEIKQKSGTINSYIGKSNKNPSKQAVSNTPHKLINPKEAKTFYEVLESNHEISLVKVQPKTGRKHQIRVHLHSIGHPIVGDKKYFIGEGEEFNKKFLNLMLHAFKIEFTGADNKNYSFSAPLPPHFSKLFEKSINT